MDSRTTGFHLHRRPNEVILVFILPTEASNFNGFREIFSSTSTPRRIDFVCDNQFSLRPTATAHFGGRIFLADWSSITSTSRPVFRLLHHLTADFDGFELCIICRIFPSASTPRRIDTHLHRLSAAVTFVGPSRLRLRAFSYE